MRRATTTSFKTLLPRRPSRFLIRLLIPYLVFVIALASFVIVAPPAKAADFTFIATKSAYVQFTTPDTNFGGTAFSINVDCCDAGAIGKSRGLVEFDVSSVVGQTLVSADLRLNLIGFGTESTRTQCTTQIASSWGESTVTWNNQPGLTVLPAECITIPRTVGFYQWDAFDFVVGWLDLTVTNNGLKVIDATEDVGGAGAVRQYNGRGAGDQAPALLVTVQDTVNFQVFVDGQLTVISVELNSSIDFKTIVENTGNALIDEVNLILFNETNATITTGVVQNVEIDGSEFDVLRAAAADIPSTTGDFAWGIEGNFTNSTATPVDDVISFFNFTLRVVAEGALIINFRVISTSLFEDQVPRGGFTTLRVEIVNNGADALFILIFFNVGSGVASGGTPQTSSILISPSQLTPDALVPGVTNIFDFTVFAQNTGLFPITVRVLPTDATGASIGQIVDSIVVLLVQDSPEVTTLSANDIGPTDAILNGKIDSLGGLTSAKVFFILFKTDVGEASAIIIPTNKEVVTFISGYRQPTLNILEPNTNYTYEFRMEFTGGEVVGGLITFQTPVSFTNPITGIRNSLAIALSLDSITMGIILGIMVLFFAIFIGSIVTDTPIVLAILGMGAAVFNWSVDWWPLWTLVVFIVLIGILLFRLPQFGLEDAA